jgi:phosphoribosylformylglycinamidine cyclo-ligase
MNEQPTAGLTYRDAGVDIFAGDQAVDMMRDLVASTHRPEVRGGIGGFGGMFAVPSGYRKPVLVAGTDGVGTKLEVARLTGRWDTVGIDLVAMCVDDLVCQGAEPLFFLDYQALGRIDPVQVRQIMVGIAEGCRQAGCAILGGELAEHPGTMEPGQIDLAGFAVGIVEEDGVLDPATASPGNVLIGLHSPGLRSNGYSLARRALLERGRRALDGPAWEGGKTTLADELLRPSVIYTKAVLHVLRKTTAVKTVAHITGGGLPGNLPRALPPGTDAVLRMRTWPVPRIFVEIRSAGRISDDEMLKVFNLGLGMVLVVERDAADEVVHLLAEQGQDATVVGEVVAGSGRFRLI